MKNLMYFMGLVFLIIACGEEENVPYEVVEEVTVPKISYIERDGQVTQRFFYEEDRLVEIQDEVYQYIEATDSAYYETQSRYLEYENDRLRRVHSGSYEVNITYEGEDMIITDFRSQFDNEYMRFKNYKTPAEFRFELYMDENFNAEIKANFDENKNFLYATDDLDVAAYDRYPGHYFYSQYYGFYSYLDKHHHMSGLDVEVQIYLFQKPFYNCVDEIDYGIRKVYYEYEFNEDNFPISSAATSVYTDNDSLYHGKKDFFYE